MDTLTDDFKQKYEQLILASILPGPGYGFSMRQGNTLYYLSKQDKVSQVDLKQPVPDNDEIPAWLNIHRAVFLKYNSTKVIIQSRLPYTLTATRAAKTVPPLLDDFAQLVGVTARVAKGFPVETRFPGKIVRKLKRRNAVLIQHSGGLCIAGSFDDAVAVAQVLEKNCRAVVYSAFLGGGKRINVLEAWLMRLVYRYKYSRIPS